MSFIDYVLLLLATFLLCLLMMNLLIGILSFKLEEVIESRAESKNVYKELSNLIFDLELLIFKTS